MGMGIGELLEKIQELVLEVKRRESSGFELKSFEIRQCTGGSYEVSKWVIPLDAIAESVKRLLDITIYRDLDYNVEAYLTDTYDVLIYITYHVDGLGDTFRLLKLEYLLSEIAQKLF